MAYSELIKNFEKIRSYMRDFYVYGFKGRDAFDAKSKRVYDDESRRVKGWLEGYIDSYYDDSGKKVFISIDSRTISHNPLYVAFKAKSFTDWDITLHFFLLDILSDGPATIKQCLDRITDEYLNSSAGELPDEGTMNPKTLQYLMGHSDISVTLNTYTHLGLEDAETEIHRMEELETARREQEKLAEKEEGFVQHIAV